VALESAVLEIEVRDARTGEPLGVLVDSEPGRAAGNEEPSWKGIQETLNFYATRFKAAMLQTNDD
jgi:hypothetical protein